MRRTFIGVVAFALLLGLNAGFVPAMSSQTLNLPMLPAARSGCFTKIDRMTDDLLVLDGFAGKKAFKLTDGSPVEKYEEPNQNASYSDNFLDSSVKGPAGNFPYAVTDDGKRYIPGVNYDCNKKDEYGHQVSNCGVSDIFADGYYIFSQTQNNYMFYTYKIFKVGNDKELWSINLYGQGWHASRFGKWLMFNGSYNHTYSIYEIDTGRNVLNASFSGKMYGYPRLLSDKYFIISGTIFDTTNWKVVHDVNLEHLGLRLSGDTLTALIIDQSHKTTDKKWVAFYYEWNLADGTMADPVELDVPMFNGSTNSMFYSAFKGFVYCFNCVNKCYELVDVNSGKVVFSHKIEDFDYLSGGQGQADNGRYFIYMDYASIFCYDTQTGKQWSRQNTYLVTSGGCDGTWFIDHQTVDRNEVLNLVNTEYPKRKVTITKLLGEIYTEDDCVLELVEEYFGTNSTILRHELDGTVKTFETPIDPQHFLYPFLSNGQWHFIKTMGGKIYVLTTTKDGFQTVYVHDCSDQSTFYRAQDTELMFTIDKTKLVIVDLSTLKEQIFEDEKGFDWAEFAGKRYVLFDENRIGKAILDRKNGQITTYDKKSLGYFGCDNETLYFSGENKFATFTDGKMDIRDIGYRVSGFVKNGYISDGYTLYDTTGKFIQKLATSNNPYVYENDIVDMSFPSISSLSITLKDDRSIIQTYFKNCVDYQPCPSYSLNRSEKGLTLENLSKQPISGTVWTADLTSKENIIELKSEDFTCKGGTSTDICTKTMTDHCLVYVESNAMMDTSKSELENVRDNYNLPVFEGNPVDSSKQKSVVVTVWDK